MIILEHPYIYRPDIDIYPEEEGFGDVEVWKSNFDSKTARIESSKSIPTFGHNWVFCKPNIETLKGNDYKYLEPIEKGGWQVININRRLSKCKWRETVFTIEKSFMLGRVLAKLPVSMDL